MAMALKGPCFILLLSLVPLDALDNGVIELPLIPPGTMETQTQTPTEPLTMTPTEPPTTTEPPTMTTTHPIPTTQPPTTSNDQFLRRHWDFPKMLNWDNSAYCHLQTSCRRINGWNNTFIHNRIATINRICSWKCNGPVTSHRRFRITVCRFNPVTSSYRGMSLTRRIRVFCRNRLPVRYIRFIRRPL